MVLVSPSAVSPNNFSQLSSGDASDSICPKGWGMAGLDGDGSYQRLIANIYGMNKTSIIMTQDYKEFNRKIQLDEILLQSLMVLHRSGIYYFDNGNFGNRGSEGRFLENSLVSDIDINYLYFRSVIIFPQTRVSKGYGLSVRCVAKALG